MGKGKKLQPIQTRKKGGEECLLGAAITGNRESIQPRRLSCCAIVLLMIIKTAMFLMLSMQIGSSRGVVRKKTVSGDLEGGVFIEKR